MRSLHFIAALLSVGHYASCYELVLKNDSHSGYDVFLGTKYILVDMAADQDVNRRILNILAENNSTAPTPTLRALPIGRSKTEVPPTLRALPIGPSTIGHPPTEAPPTYPTRRSLDTMGSTTTEFDKKDFCKHACPAGEGGAICNCAPYPIG